MISNESHVERWLKLGRYDILLELDHRSFHLRFVATVIAVRHRQMPPSARGVHGQVEQSWGYKYCGQWRQWIESLQCVRLCECMFTMFVHRMCVEFWLMVQWSSNVKESKIWSIEHRLNWSLSPEGRCWSHHRSLCWFLVQGAWQMNTELKNWWGIMHKPLLHLTLLKTRLVIKGRGKRCQPAGQILTQWFTVHASLHKWLDRWCTQRDDVQNLATFSNTKPMLF